MQGISAVDIHLKYLHKENNSTENEPWHFQPRRTENGVFVHIKNTCLLFLLSSSYDINKQKSAFAREKTILVGTGLHQLEVDFCHVDTVRIWRYFKSQVNSHTTNNGLSVFIRSQFIANGNYRYLRKRRKHTVMKEKKKNTKA